MAESTLGLHYHDFAGEIGAFLGYGWGEENGDTTWTTDQQRNIDVAVKAGQREFYDPPVLPNERTAHRWSFMHALGTASLTSGNRRVALPENFKELDGEVMVAASGSGYTPLSLYNPGRLGILYTTSPDATGIPCYVALEPTGEIGVNRSSRYQLYVYPQSDATYTLSFYYMIDPEAISDARRYCYGGGAHVQTLLAAMKACAERDRNNIYGGPHWSNFMARLQTSISLDRMNRGDHYGNDTGGSYYPTRGNWGVATINGVDPT